MWANRSGRSPKMSHNEWFAQVAHQKWTNEQIACFFERIAHSLIFLQKKVICSENRWANSQPWQYSPKNFHRNINLNCIKEQKTYGFFFCSNFPLLLILNRTKYIQYLLSTVPVYLVYCILFICLQYLHCPSAVGWSDFWRKQLGARQVESNRLKTPNPKMFYGLLLISL